jgi:hypothetical protein
LNDHSTFNPCNWPQFLSLLSSVWASDQADHSQVDAILTALSLISLFCFVLGFGIKYSDQHAHPTTLFHNSLGSMGLRPVETTGQMHTRPSPQPLLKFRWGSDQLD